MTIYCPRCRAAMKYQHTLPIGRGSEVLYTCDTCRVRCRVETSFYFDADLPDPTTPAQDKP